MSRNEGVTSDDIDNRKMIDWKMTLGVFPRYAMQDKIA